MFLPWRMGAKARVQLYYIILHYSLFSSSVVCHTLHYILYSLFSNMSSEHNTQHVLRKSSIASVTALIALQLFSRLFTFVLNQALIRLTSPQVFGAAVIQFELVLSTILFLSREGIRTTILRVKSPGSRELNLSFVPAIVGVPLALAIAWPYAEYADEELKARALFREAVAVSALAAVIELLTEPFHNV